MDRESGRIRTAQKRGDRHVHFRCLHTLHYSSEPSVVHFPRVGGRCPDHCSLWVDFAASFDNDARSIQVVVFLFGEIWHTILCVCCGV